MSTVKNKAVRRQPRKTAPIAKAEPVMNAPQDFKEIELSAIDISPLNYRKSFDLQALEDFALELAVHGVIAPVTLRPMPTGRYELVVGERRFRASRIASLPTIPAMIRELTDEEVIEIQLSENLQREDPHPLYESHGIMLMQQAGKSIGEIAVRLGKSKAFVYGRIKLAGLISVISDIFLANKMSMQEALDIASLSAQSQNDFYEEYCTDWQDDDFDMPGRYALNRFRYDLNYAPFDIKDKKLIAEKGACTNCPLNSATLKTLFPEMAKEAVCSGKQCYQSKCNRHWENMIREAVMQLPPQALLFSNGSFCSEIAPLLDSIEEIKDLPRYNKWEVSVITAPLAPQRQDYNLSDDETEDFDEQGYAQALDEYNSEIDEYHELINSGKALSGLHITERGTSFMLFASKGFRQGSGQSAKVTAKQVQEAIKEGTVTPEILQAEINRINDKETRAKELDIKNTQLQLHELFAAQFSVPENNKELTNADAAAVRLIVYQSLDYNHRSAVDRLFFDTEQADTKEGFFDLLSSLTQQQFCYMIRMAITGKSDSKYPQNITAYCLRKIACEAGTDVAAIEQQQQDKAAERQTNLDARIADLEKRIQKLKAKQLPEKEEAETI